MADDITISQASPLEAEAILSLQKRGYITEAELYNDYAITPLTQTLPEITHEFEHMVFLKAEAANAIVGTVRAYQKDGTCFIGRLVVDHAWRKKGIGGKLLAEVEKLFFRAKRYELFTGHKSDNNIRFYKRYGYAIIRREDMFVYMEKVNPTTNK